MVKVKAYELRKKDQAELLKDVEGFKKELMELRVAQVTGSAATKLARIRIVRKSIARALTVHNEKRRSAAKELYKGKKYIPKDLRIRTTRAMRRKLTPQQANKKTVLAQKKASNLAPRRFALLA